MACHYHPERESTDICAICGKEICKECGLEIAGKIYCKDCLQKIVGLSLETQPQAEEPQEQIRSEPVRLEKKPEQNIYDVQEEVSYEPEPQEVSKISADSPYNIKDNIQYSGGLESSYISENENMAQKPQTPEMQPQVAQNEIDFHPQEQAPIAKEQEYIYPDHSYQPEPTSARVDLEDKYEKYLDDLYFDEPEVPLGEQLAKDEEQYGSLTRKKYKAPEKPAEEQKRAKPNRPETPEEMEARIRAEILEEQGIKPKDIKRDKKDRTSNSIHNLNYQDEKEPMGAVDILLTIVLVIVILIVIYYIIYLFILHASYPTFMDAVYGLSNPQNVINNLLSGSG